MTEVVVEIPPPLDIIEFLNALEDMPCLWLKSHPKYKLRSARDTAGDYLLDSFKRYFRDKTELRKKIRNIRNGYNQEIAKIRKSTKTGTSPINVYKPKLFWFEEANRFLSKNLGDAPNLFSNMVEEERNEDENTVSETHNSILNDDNPTDIVYDTRSDEAVNNFIADDEVQEELIELSVTDIEMDTNKRRKRKDVTGKDTTTTDQRSTLQKTVEVLESLNRHRTSKMSKTEFALFGETIGKQLEDMPKKDAIRVQLQIQTIIANARLNNME